VAVVERTAGGSSLIDVLDRVLDKGIVIDAWVRISLVGIDLITVEARVVVASIDTYLRYADALGISPAPGGRGLGSGGGTSCTGTPCTLSTMQYSIPADVTLINRDFANPLFVLDEIDKAGGDSRYDPLGALYTLLEPETAQRFCDEFIDMELDASHILWIATANDASMIPEPILNRMNVYAIDRPDAAGARTIALAVYHEILDAHRWPFPPEPTESVLERLAAVPARDMRKLLLDAFGTARLANRDYLVPEDIDAKKLCGRKARVGF